MQAVLLCSGGGGEGSLYTRELSAERLTEGLFCYGVDSIPVRHIGIYRYLFLLALKNPIINKMTLTNKNNINMMN